MQRIGKMRDFSIESILADTDAFNCRNKHYQSQNGKNAEEEIILGFSKKEINLTSLKSHLCIIKDSKQTFETNDASNCEVNVKKTSEIDTTKKQFFIDKFYINFEQGFECDRYNNFATLYEGKCTDDNETSTGHVTEVAFDSNEINNTKIIEKVRVRGKLKSKRFIFEEFDISCRNINKNASVKNMEIKGRQKISPVRNLKINKKTKFEINQKKYSDSQMKRLNENPNTTLLINQYNRLNDDRKTLEVKSNYLLLSNQSRKFIDFSEETGGCPQVARSKLDWLHCTRYKPPKVPRKSRVDKNKRKASLYPRVPFSTFQLDILEEKFRNSAYLSKNDVLYLSDTLKLPSKKVKIWFQNRRARERRDSNAYMQ